MEASQKPEEAVMVAENVKVRRPPGKAITFGPIRTVPRDT